MNDRMLFGLGILLAGLLLLVPSPARAATIDEILAMNDAGLSPEVIIDVIDATGLEEPLDIDTLIMLQKKGVNEQVIEYLAGMLPDESQDQSGDSENRDSEQSNRLGGEGFHHSNRYENAQGQDSYYDYWEPSGDWNGYYPPLGSISIYEPPVYFIENKPYYHGWRAPRVYPRRHDYRGYPYGYWYPDGYVVPFDNDYWWSWSHDRGRGWNGGWYWDGRDFRRYGSLDAWYSDNDFSFRISF